ncbi:MAG: tetratricopeptide repeat protein [Candidatus Eisenbacteria bacterium]|uniref:Tetratricopeptide repeat protein n=1 Tax=Eiseniibacteriota bacterium TaxID=2212470 RepID=A0A538TXF5_UNCEI|nr:MAG: tetratricopeptide repeat protein [Candidatus Eisenbacteria bacterium]
MPLSPRGGRRRARGCLRTRLGDRGRGPRRCAEAAAATPPAARPQPGALAVAVVIYMAIKANYERATAPIEGSSEAQQAAADSVLRAIERDSTDVTAHVRLANILFDTGNWSDAIVHYRAALRRDSSQVTAIVDLGVCYFNLGESDQAERHFELALAHDPHQPIALFNLGIVHEHRKDYRGALGYFHRALQSGPPDNMQQPLVEAITRIQRKTGTQAPPLPEAR